MKKRVLAILCMLAIVVSVFAVAATATTDNSELYKVGYAKKSINPIKDTSGNFADVNPNEGSFVTIPLSGGIVNTGAALTDDNGDGKTDKNDGVFVTCTSVTDAYGVTILYITMDTIGAYKEFVDDVKVEIVSALNSKVSADQILISGTHSHTGPNIWSMYEDTNYQAYIAYIKAQVVAAAEAAFSEQQPATMSKGSIDTYTATGYELNYVRHYKNNYSGAIAGDNFGGDVNTSYLVTSHIADSNDDMQLLQFTPENTAYEPIVLINWNAHPSLVAGEGNEVVSGDYVNALRYKLEKANYRAAVFLGASGNINPQSRITAKNLWPNDTTYSFTSNKKSNLYGYLLADVALMCLGGEKGSLRECDTGAILTKQVTYQAARQIDSDGLRAAADACAAAGANSFPYTYNGYTLNSWYHYNAVKNTRGSWTAGSTYPMELNAIALGKEVAFVTAPGELFDRYSATATLDTVNEDNDWDDLLDTNLLGAESYGTPFVLGYTNANNSYIPNTLAYNYNEGSSTYGAGSYEANISYVAEGEGEKIIAKYADMLKEVIEPRKAECEHCDSVQIWQPLTQANYASTALNGHYYLTESISDVATKDLADGATACLDLNSETITGKGRAFNLNAGTLSIQDSGTGGAVKAVSTSSNANGGVIVVGASATVNLYSGTLAYSGANTTTNRGGIVTCNGTFNMHGGTINGIALVDSTASMSAKGCGGSVFIYSTGTFDMSGGNITAGTAVSGNDYTGAGDCVYVYSSSSSYGKIKLSGNASVEEIYFAGDPANNLTIQGAYTGAAALKFGTDVSDGSVIGTSDSAVLTNATLTCVDNDALYVLVDNTSNKLKLTSVRESTVAMVDGEQYESLADAIEAYSDTSVAIKLLKDVQNVSPETMAAKVYLDLNGNDINGIDLPANGTLYCMDSQTDDYSSPDSDSYGKITGSTGLVRAVPAGSAVSADLGDQDYRAGYLMITAEGDTGVSFHRVNLQLHTVSLHIGKTGIQYKSQFAGDEVVAANVADYGVAVSTLAVPDANNLDSKCGYTALMAQNGSFNEGAAGNAGTSTVLTNIMKPTQGYQTNNANANTAVNGRAYIKLKDGQGYIFGGNEEWSLKDVVQAVNEYWDDLDLTGTDTETLLVNMYKTYTSVMGSWNLDKIKEAAASENDGVLKILAIGNSYSEDSMRLLCEVYAEENPGKQIVLGRLYKGGAALDYHVDQLERNNGGYYYYKIKTGSQVWENYIGELDGETIVNGKTIFSALKEENWDVVVLQQASAKSFLPQTYNEDIATIRRYVSNILGYTPEFAWNMTWSYASYYTGSTTFKNTYGSDPSSMYEDIASAVQTKIANGTNGEFEYLMPVGTAIQYARENNDTITDELSRDGTHLSELGRLIAAYTWYCELEGITELTGLKLTTIPQSLTYSGTSALDLSDYEQIIIDAVNAAMQNKFAVSTN